MVVLVFQQHEFLVKIWTEQKSFIKSFLATASATGQQKQQNFHIYSEAVISNVKTLKC